MNSHSELPTYFTCLYNIPALVLVKLVTKIHSGPSFYFIIMNLIESTQKISVFLNYIALIT